MKRLKTRRLKGMIRFVRMVAGVIHVACPSRETDYGEVVDRGEHETDKIAGGLNTSKSFNGIMSCPDIIIGKIHGEGFSIR
jgi:hypothetical protein